MKAKAKEGELLEKIPEAWECKCGSTVFWLRENSPQCAGCGQIHDDITINYPQETQDPCLETPLLMMTTG